MIRLKPQLDCLTTEGKKGRKKEKRKKERKKVNMNNLTPSQA
jgi:hypothetical protein